MTAHKTLIAARRNFTVEWRWSQFAVGFNFDTKYGELLLGLGPLVLGWSW